MPSDSTMLRHRFRDIVTSEEEFRGVVGQALAVAGQAAIRAAGVELGFEPKVDIREGLRRTAAWYLEHGDLA